MGSASITINVDGKWNGSGAVEQAKSSLQGLGNISTQSADRVARAMNRQRESFHRVTRAAASTSKSTSQSVAIMGENIVAAGGQMYAAGKKMESVGESLAVAITAPLVVAGGKASDAAIRFDTALANVRKTTDMAEADLQKLGQAAIELSKTQPVSAETILNVEALGAQLGIAKGNLQDFARVATGLDIATNMSAEQAATEMARFANIMNMSQTDMERYASTIVYLGNHFATTESEISTMAQRLASAGKTIGLSEAQVLGLSASMSSLGIRSEMGGSALSQVFVKISRSVTNGGDELEAFARRAGMSAEDFKKAWETDAAGAFTALLDGVSHADDMNDALKELGITSLREGDVMRRLAGNTDLVKQALGGATQAWKDNSALQAEVDQRNESMASRIQVLKNKVEALATQVGVPLVNALIAAADAVSPLLNTASDLATAFASADEGTQRLVISIAGIAAAAGPTLNVLGKVAKGLGSAETVIGNVVREFAVYKDAANTTDAAQLRIYASSKTMASQIGIASNSIANAAGGVENYIDACDRMAAAQGKAEAFSKKADEAGLRAAKSGRKQAKAAREIQDAFIEKANAASAEVQSTQAQITAWEQAAQASGGVASKVGSLVTGLKGLAMGAVAAAGPMLATVAVTAAVSAAVGFAAKVIGDFAEKARLAEERQKRMADASQSLASISAEAAAGAQSQAKALDEIAGSGKKACEAVIDLNKKSKEVISDYEVSAATVDSYANSIKELTSKGQLNEVQQARLAIAVKGYNDATGSSIEITDGATGQLSISTEELEKNTEAWKRNAEIQAYQQVAGEYLQQHAKDYLALSQAKDELARINEELYPLEEKSGHLTYEEAMHRQDLLEKIKKLTPEIEELSTAEKSSAESAEYASAKVAMMSEAGQELTNTFSELKLEAPLHKAGIDLDQFGAKLLEAGVSSDTLRQIGSENIGKLAQAFDGDLTKIVWAIQNYNAVPVEDKDGTVSINDAELIDGQDRVYVWNDGELVDKETQARCDYAELVDGQGHLWVWDGSELVSKSATAIIEGNVISGKAKSAVDTTAQSVAGLSGSTVDVSAVGTVATGAAKSKVDNTRSSIGDLSSKSINVTANGNIPSGNATERIQDAKSNIDRVSGKDVTVAAYTRGESDIRNFKSMLNSIPTSVHTTLSVSRRNAAGGFAFHADGGVVVPRYHARGAIASRAVPLTDIVGEAGAEAIVPLTNRRYAMPFVRMIASEVGARTGAAAGVSNTYNLTINGLDIAANDRIGELLQALGNEFSATMGVI
ncbi:phage tail tape measure protein [Collinsella sp. AGMB00827]|uniref:Phage tail tape measure protein n=1 Tax=Collinsella ureilytica TaxID=2869515 RepID=A0ABS7MHE5_9ACTN|nr:phage tail tape measure protein [Collinsella urealyticum]MBY4796781.1 phage tail tape measure protein [Collinsella urealyticum]